MELASPIDFASSIACRNRLPAGGLKGDFSPLAQTAKARSLWIKKPGPSLGKGRLVWMDRN
jgi:hypothetical protein